MDNFNLKKYLAEGRLFEEENPIWTIDSTEDSADIEQAGSAYKKAIVNIIKAKHSNISSEDLEKSIEVTNDYWYDESRQTAKGSDPENIKVSAEEFAGSAIEYYEDALMPDSGDGDKEEDNFEWPPPSFPSDKKPFDHNLKWYIKNKGIPKLNPDVKADFLNFAEKVLKPANAGLADIEAAIDMFYRRQIKNPNFSSIFFDRPDSIRKISDEDLKKSMGIA